MALTRYNGETIIAMMLLFQQKRTFLSLESHQMKELPTKGKEQMSHLMHKPGEVDGMLLEGKYFSWLFAHARQKMESVVHPAKVTRTGFSAIKNKIIHSPL